MIQWHQQQYALLVILLMIKRPNDPVSLPHSITPFVEEEEISNVLFPVEP